MAAKRPFDLDALAADTKLAPFAFIHGAETYEMPPRPDVLALDYLSKNNVMACLHILLGDEQYDRLNESDIVFDTTRFTALLEAYFEHSGLDMGKARASTKR